MVNCLYAPVYRHIIKVVLVILLVVNIIMISSFLQTGKSELSSHSRFLGQNFISVDTSASTHLRASQEETRSSFDWLRRNDENKVTHISIILPVYNNFEMVHQTLLSIFSQEPASFSSPPNSLQTEVVIIDGGSKEGFKTKLAYIQSKHVNKNGVSLSIIHMNKQTSFKESMKRGLEFASGHALFVLRPGSILAPHTLYSLYNIFEGDGSVGTVSFTNQGMLYDEDRPERLSSSEISTLVRKLTRGASVMDMSTKMEPSIFAIRSSILNKISLKEFVSAIAGGKAQPFFHHVHKSKFKNVIHPAVYAYQTLPKELSLKTSQERNYLFSDISLKNVSSPFHKYPKKVLPSGLKDLRKRVDFTLKHIDPEAYFNSPLPSIFFILYARRMGGGVVSILTDCLVLNQLGHYCALSLHESAIETFRETYLSKIDIPVPKHILFGYSKIQNAELLAPAFDVSIATIYNSIEGVQRAMVASCDIVPGYYIQDYEPYFAANSKALYDLALSSYSLIEGNNLFAKTDWMKRFVEIQHNVSVHRIQPSIDPYLYEFRQKLDAIEKNMNANNIVKNMAENADDFDYLGGFGELDVKKRRKVRISAMIRFNTLRRRPYETLEVLNKLEKANPHLHLEFHVFGSDLESFDQITQEMELPHHMVNYGKANKDQLIDILKKTDIFVDFSEWQAFGRTGLEAMLFNTVPVLPMYGGVTAYATHNYNALVLNSTGVEHYVNGISALLQQPELLEEMKVRGEETARMFPPQISGESISELFTPEMVSAWRKKYAPNCN